MQLATIFAAGAAATLFSVGAVADQRVSERSTHEERQRPGYCEVTIRDSSNNMMVRRQFRLIKAGHSAGFTFNNFKYNVPTTKLCFIKNPDTVEKLPDGYYFYAKAYEGLGRIGMTKQTI
ncbi:uncharacterized protein PgNI_12000 [Pyricularia grisea]|uniref:Uncharacterized protein n=1 Tax=Pyricularia grisea TaxID=148305 RepID=A0A6P8AR35_PYRGI|nr:uncharacterized protein PgNI_12000 [Pyricularia grisea]TLD04514.1 hypothetical protein PgNI_12000 [Pyricularia grisea]